MSPVVLAQVTVVLPLVVTQFASGSHGATQLFGSSKGEIVESIRTGRGGQMPRWAGRLDTTTTKSLAVYVHSLGGGK